MDISLQKLKTTLKGAKYSSTKSRQAVFTALLTLGPMSVSTIAEQLEKQVDRATVYRTIELFEKLGIVNRIWHGFKHQIELSEIFTPHHHHGHCQNCDRMVDIASSELEAILATTAKRHNFLAVNHSVEISGYCSNCH